MKRLPNRTWEGRNVPMAVLGAVWISMAGCATFSMPTIDEDRAEAKPTTIEPASTEVEAADAERDAERGFVEIGPETAEPAIAEAPAPAAEPDWPDSLSLESVHVTEESGLTGLAIRLTRPADRVKHFPLDSPERLVIDFYGAVSDDVPFLRREIETGERFERMRVGRFEDRLRTVFDAARPIPSYTVDTTDATTVVFLGERRAGLAGERLQETVYAAAPAADAAPTELVRTRVDEPLAPAGEDDAPADQAAEAGSEPEAPMQVAARDPAPPSAEWRDKEDERMARSETALWGTVDEDAAADREAEERMLVAEEPAPADVAPARIEREANPQYTGERVSLDFKDADVLNVLRILAEVSGLNIVATDDVSGRITLKLTEVPWDQALDIVLQANRLDMVREGNVIRISTVTRLKEEREERLAAQDAARELEPLVTEYIPVSYMKLEEDEGPEKGLTKKLLSVLSSRGSVNIDSRTNTIILRDVAEGRESAKEMITELDQRTPQVLIESHIVEVNETFLKELGIQWGYSLGVGPQFGTPTGYEFPASILFGGSGLGFGAVPGTGPASPILREPNSPVVNSGPTVGQIGSIPGVPVPFIADFPAPNAVPGAGAAFDLALGSIDGSRALNARLTALENDGKVKIVSRPKVQTINNLPAVIESLQIFRVRLPGTGTVVATGAGGVAGGGAAATEEIRTGITLNVTPQVSADGFILLAINVKSSTPDFTQAVDNIPAEISREAISNVLIENGETVVLGGVYRDNNTGTTSGIPFLKDIPAIGWLFKRNVRQQNREELLVFITPRLVQGGATIMTQPSATELWEGRTR